MATVTGYTAAKVDQLIAGVSGGSGGGGVTDHGALNGLGDDDHTQYHTNARGDARYYTKGQTDALLSGATPSSASGALPRGMAAVVMGLANVDVEPFKILFVGDSLTHDGIQDATLAIWPTHLIKRLTHMYQPGTTPVALVENRDNMTVAPSAGIVGWNISKPAVGSGSYVQSAEVTIAQAMQPRVIFHCIGANDRMGSFSPVNAANNIRAAINALDAAIDPKPVHVLHWFGSLYHDKPWPVDTLVGYYIDIASENPSHRVALDLGPYADTLGINDNISGTGDPYGLDGDALHLTAKGYRMWGELVFRALTAAPAANVLGWSAPQPTAPGATTTTTTVAGTTTTTTTAPATITDSFNRADSTTGLGVTDTGQTWVQLGTNPVGIIDNTAYRVANSAFAAVDFGQADMLVTVRCTVTTGYFGGPVARIVDADNYYYVDTQPTGLSARLRKYVAGSELSVTGATNHAFTTGDLLGIQCKEVAGGTELKLLINGVVVQTLTDNAVGRPITGTMGGIRPWTIASARFDDFSIEAPGAAGTTTTTTTAAGTTTTTTTASAPATITDSFNRADSTTGLGVTDTGQTWEHLGAGVAGISGNAAYRVSGTAIAVVPFGSADMDVTVKLTTVSDFFRIYARVVDVNNYYLIESGGSGTTVKMHRMVAGTQTSISAAYAIAVGDTVTLRAKTNGANVDLSLLINGVVKQTVSQTGAQVLTGTKGGLGGVGSNAFRLDDFSVTAAP